MINSKIEREKGENRVRRKKGKAGKYDGGDESEGDWGRPPLLPRALTAAAGVTQPLFILQFYHHAALHHLLFPRHRSAQRLSIGQDHEQPVRVCGEGRGGQIAGSLWWVPEAASNAPYVPLLKALNVTLSVRLRGCCLRPRREALTRGPSPTPGMHEGGVRCEAGLGTCVEGWPRRAGARRRRPLRAATLCLCRDEPGIGKPSLPG